MGNTTAEWFVFAAEPFRARFQDHPRAVPQARWRELVERGTQVAAEHELELYAPAERAAARAQVERQREQRRELLLTRAPGADGSVSLDDEDGARVLLDACQAECGRGSWRAWDVIHDMDDGLTWDLAPELLDAGEDAMAEAWQRLWAAMGKDGPPAQLPWWVRRAFDPEGWYVGLIEPAQAVKLQSALDLSELRERAGALLAARDAQAARSWERLLALLDRAAADDCWLLAAESMS